jgi:integrase
MDTAHAPVATAADRLREADRIVAGWLLARGSRSPRTLAAYRAALRRAWPDLMAVWTRSGQLTAADAAALAASWRSRWPPATAALTLSVVRSWWRDMVAQGHLPGPDPWAAVRAPPPDHSTLPRRVLTRSEALALLAACTDVQERVLAGLLLLTGCRISEALAATWEQIRVQADGRYWTFSGKGSRTRTVWIQPELWAGLQALPLPHTGPLFPGRSRYWGYRVIHGAGRRAGLADRIVSPHVLRHTHATLAVEAGIPLLEIAEQLGHARLDTTRIYVDLRPGPRSARAVRLTPDP